MNILESIDKLIQRNNNQTIVFIKGNTEHAKVKNQLKELEQFYSEVISVIKKYTSNLIIIESNIKSDKIPIADKYIGHSRGCGYKFAIKKSIYFCLDKYENVPKSYYNFDYTKPLETRPMIHPEHMKLNQKMKSKLIEFLKL